MSFHSPQQNHSLELLRYYLSQQETMPYPTTTLPAASSPSTVVVEQATPDSAQTKKPQIKRNIVIVTVLALACALYFIWRPSSAPAAVSPSITPQNSTPGKTSTTANTATGSSSGASGTIQVYIVGAVQNPGVYTLNANARVYQLLQAAGGPLSNADLTRLNLAAKLSDGQEVDVTTIGEAPPDTGGTPTSATGGGDTGQLVNINTASATELQQGLHVSSTTAKNIVSYRTQHGQFSSVADLLQVVSKTIYDRIKSQVTV